MNVLRDSSIYVKHSLIDQFSIGKIFGLINLSSVIKFIRGKIFSENELERLCTLKSELALLSQP